MLRNSGPWIGCWLVILLLCACDADTGTTSVGGGDSGSTGGGDTQNDGLCSHPDNAIIDASAGAHGSECTSNSDCQYGRCVSSPLITGGALSFCTKQCNCGANSVCADDVGANGEPATCLRFGATYYPDEPDTAYCAQICKSLDDCLALSAGYTHCETAPVGVQKVCVAK